MAREIGGFSLGEGVNLVKYISKKKVEKIHAMRDKFMSGAHEKGCPKEDADLIWDMIEAGGSYIFNKSHATAYAITSYVGAWLKANYPTAFYTIALQWADDKELPLIMSEMEECSSAKVVPPDINTSAEKFFTDYRTNEIFWSLGKIKILGTKAVQYIIDERTKGGPFKSIENFIHRIFKYKLKKYEYWDDADNEQEAVRVPVNARHVKNLILAGCFDKVSNISAVVERYSILDKAATELGFKIPTGDYPDHLINQHYFWSMQQIEVCGIGRIDYKRIYDNSYCRHQFKGRASYSTVHNALLSGSEGKKVALCATVTEMEEISYKDKKTGERKHLCKLHLQQNNDLIKLVCWNDFYIENKTELQDIKGKIVIVSAIVKYNDYSGGNSLNTYKTSRLFTLNQSSENQINQEDGSTKK